MITFKKQNNKQTLTQQASKLSGGGCKISALALLCNSVLLSVASVAVKSRNAEVAKDKCCSKLPAELTINK